MSQLGLDPARLVFLDETWAKTDMTRTRGRAPRGERSVAAVPHGHWRTTTLIAAIDRDGVRCSTTLDGPVDRDAFEAFCRDPRAPRGDGGKCRCVRDAGCCAGPSPTRAAWPV